MAHRDRISGSVRRRAAVWRACGALRPRPQCRGSDSPDVGDEHRVRDVRELCVPAGAASCAGHRRRRRDAGRRRLHQRAVEGPGARTLLSPVRTDFSDRVDDDGADRRRARADAWLAGHVSHRRCPGPDRHHAAPAASRVATVVDFKGTPRRGRRRHPRNRGEHEAGIRDSGSGIRIPSPQSRVPVEIRTGEGRSGHARTSSRMG